MATLVQDPRLAHASLRLSRALSVALVVMGGLVLAGWSVRMPALTSFLRDAGSMKVNTAALFSLLGVALLAETDARGDLVRRASALVILGVSGLTVAEYLGRFDLGIDQLLVPDPGTDIYPGRMAPATAAAFFSFAIVSLFSRCRGQGAIRATVAALVAGWALLGLSGYMFRSAALYTIRPFTAVALPTLLGMLAAALATVAARPDSGLAARFTDAGTAGRTLRRSFPIVVCVPPVLAWLTLVGLRAGLYDGSFGIALVSSGNVIALAAMTLLTNHWLERLDARRDLVDRAARREEAQKLRLRDELLQNEQFLEAVLHGMGDGVIATDRDGHVVRLNAAAATMTGWPPRDAHGRPIDEVLRVCADDGSALGAGQERARERRRGPAVLLSRMNGRTPIAESCGPVTADGSDAGFVFVLHDETKARSAFEAMRASEARYRDLYENAPDMYLSVDAETHLILDCNASIREALGFTRDELVGLPTRAILDPGQEPALTALRERFKDTGSLSGAEIRLIGKNGRVLDVSASSTAERALDGKIIRSRSVLRDIGERKQAERDLRFQLEFADAFPATSSVAEVRAASCQRIGRYLGVERCSLAEIDLLGETATIADDYCDGVEPRAGKVQLSSYGAQLRAELSAGKTVVIANAQDDPRTAALYAQSYEPAQLRALIVVPVLREGRWLATLSVTSPRARSWTQREVSLLQLLSERTWQLLERSRLLAQVHGAELARVREEGERRFRLLVEAVRDYLIITLDASGHVQTWNDGATRIAGYGEREVIGRDFSIFFTDEDRSRGAPERELALAAERGTLELEGWRVRKDGSRFMADIVMTALRDDAGAIIGFAKITRDISERRLTEERLQIERENLARSLREREVLLQEIHHRVKNNLQIISSLINMQARQLPEGIARAALMECRGRVVAMALIHERLYQTSDFGRVPFSDYVQTLSHQIFELSAGTAGRIALHFDVEPLQLTVEKAIPCGLLLNELVTNALKHAFPGERRGSLSIELRRLAEAKVCIGVHDDGIGLPVEVDPATASSMGMQLIGTLAEQLHGRLEVTRSSGTQLRIIFPLVVQPSVPAVASTAARLAACSERPS